MIAVNHRIRIPLNSTNVILAEVGIQWCAKHAIIGFSWIPGQPVKGLPIQAKLLCSKLDAKPGMTKFIVFAGRINSAGLV